MIPTVTGTRYVTPLREGGSLPGLVEADDEGTYVVKFRAAGQGPKVLAAEIIAGELARRLGFRVPDLVLVEMDPRIARHEPDEEVQELLAASSGLNLGMDFLPGAFGFDPEAFPPDAEEASRVLWFDALIDNVDRSWRNPNLLRWHRELWLIDHGAALWFHHDWPRAGTAATRPFRSDDHVLVRHAADLAGVHRELAPAVTESLLTEVVALVPDPWLIDADGGSDAAERRAAYVSHFLRRIESAPRWLPGGTT
ncbi:hypothetical protein FHR81_000031 [Actinoalloteichus hoggarensis]|uniref:Uncharacterized protein n=1 Tax=Actinoalloteichus hoggarensis TaxID=1470176 RepID=A0A221W3F5_9PSEU|nr:HipA family kinase [Actinoalloteichus hoggarensis]ASO20284.1 hypothetical protein AHOG_13205 [Actinoalloteichus hoggarensis]MBB5919002.1 hypothetical protein [Actinoalloteichus hoggarensis]